MNLKQLTVLCAFGLLSFQACKTESKSQFSDAEKIPGIILENMDTSVRPNDDFFRYVNGSWFDKTIIPDDHSSWGGFNELRKKTDADVLTILNEAIADDLSMPRAAASLFDVVEARK